MNTLTEQQAAEFLGVSRSYLRQSRSVARRPNAIDGPPWMKFGRLIRYDREDLRAWQNDHRVASGVRP